jgi:hypothetical protein
MIVRLLDLLLTPMMQTVSSSETSVKFYQNERRHIPEFSIFHIPLSVKPNTISVQAQFSEGGTFPWSPPEISNVISAHVRKKYLLEESPSKMYNLKDFLTY